MNQSMNQSVNQPINQSTKNMTTYKNDQWFTILRDKPIKIADKLMT